MHNVQNFFASFAAFVRDRKEHEGLAKIAE
jgi:hypothetical protein